MFNETTGFGSTPECAQIKADCARRFPPSDDPDVMAGIKPDLNWDCMKARNYPTLCMDNASYDNPGATTYPIDVVTNPDNPDFVFQWPGFVKNMAEDLGLAPATLALAGGALLLFFAMKR